VNLVFKFVVCLSKKSEDNKKDILLFEKLWIGGEEICGKKLRGGLYNLLVNSFVRDEYNKECVVY